MFTPDQPIRRQYFLLISQSQPSNVSGNGVQLWSERGDLLLQLGDQAPGAAANTVTLSSDGRYIIRSAPGVVMSKKYFDISVAGQTPVSACTPQKREN